MCQIEQSKNISRRSSINKTVDKNFKKFTGKQVCIFIKKETLTQVFSCKFCSVFKKTFFAEHLREAGSYKEQSSLLHNVTQPLK